MVHWNAHVFVSISRSILARLAIETGVDMPLQPGLPLHLWRNSGAAKDGGVPISLGKVARLVFHLQMNYVSRLNFHLQMNYRAAKTGGVLVSLGIHSGLLIYYL